MIEIRVHVSGEQRVVVVSRFAEAVYVLHAFEKKSRKTPRRDIELARRRYRELMAERERRIVAVVQDFARAYMLRPSAVAAGEDVHPIEFDVTVTVTFGVMTDAVVVAEIERQDWYRSMPDRPARLHDSIAAKLAGNLQKLRRVTSVAYTIDEMRAPDGQRAGPIDLPDLGPDVWVLVAPTSRPPRS